MENQLSNAKKYLIMKNECKRSLPIINATVEMICSTAGKCYSSSKYHKLTARCAMKQHRHSLHAGEKDRVSETERNQYIDNQSKYRVKDGWKSTPKISRVQETGQYWKMDRRLTTHKTRSTMHWNEEFSNIKIWKELFWQATNWQTSMWPIQKHK